MTTRQYAANGHVPSAVIERAALRDMIYAACPRCLTSLSAALQTLPLDRLAGLSCPSCGAAVATDAIAYKYRLKLTLVVGTEVCDAMLFDEPAAALLGTPATTLRKLLIQYPKLPSLLEELVLGLRVSFTFQPAANRSASKFQRDLKVLTMQPLAPELLPEPPVRVALACLAQQRKQRRRHPAVEEADDSEEET